MPANPRLIAFLSGTAPDGAGRLLPELLAWPDQRLEQVHDFIQWMFPLPEPSPVNPGAPVLDADSIAEIRARAELQANLRKSLERMGRFYRDSRHWITPGNHNHLRITRILRCAALLGLEAEARGFFEWLSAIYEQERRKPYPGISARSFEYWSRAMRGASE
jgi:hypothetical protein